MTSQSERTFELAHSCPHCGYRMDAALNASRRPDARPPAAGDLGLCVDCGGWIVFTGEPGEQHAPNAAELAEIEANPQAAKVKATWQKIKEAGPPMTLGEPVHCWQKCPTCGQQHDMAAGAGNTDTALEPGCVALCVSCGEWMVITEAEPRKPTDAEYIDLAYSKQARMLRRAWVQMAENRDRERAAKAAESAREAGKTGK